MSAKPPFEHSIFPPPEGEMPPAFTFTSLDDRLEAAPVFRKPLGRPVMGHVIICSDCRAEFGSLDVADNTRRFNEHICRLGAEGTEQQG